ncbi:hypothetical protein [Fodinicola feengrottensis]|nr:hypothetical protein [Fodinicola feengrottensis]
MVFPVLRPNPSYAYDVVWPLFAVLASCPRASQVYCVEPSEVRFPFGSYV